MIPSLKRPLALEELKRWHADGWRAYVGRDPKPEDPILPYPDGSPWRPKSALLFRDDLEAGCDRAAERIT